MSTESTSSTDAGAPAPAASPVAPAAAPVAPAAPVAEQKPAAPAAAEPQPQQPAEQQQQKQTEQQTTGVEKYTLEANVPLAHMDDQRTQWLGDFATIGATAGVSAKDAQSLVDAFTDVATAIPYTIEHAYATPEDAGAEMVRAFGQEQAETLVRDAQRYYTKLKPQMQAYLDDTGLGNDPGVLTVLALCEQGLLKLSPEAAQKQIDQIMADPKYTSLKRDSKERLLEVAKLQILARVAQRDDPRLPPESVRKTALAQADARQADNETRKAELRAEASKLLEKGGPLMAGSGHPRNAAALKRWFEITSQL